MLLFWMLVLPLFHAYICVRTPLRNDLVDIAVGTIHEIVDIGLRGTSCTKLAQHKCLQ